MVENLHPVPYEVLDQIFSYLPSHHDPHSMDRQYGTSPPSIPSSEANSQSDYEYRGAMVNLPTLLNLCLTSKAVYAIARRHLYTQFYYNDSEQPDLEAFLIRVLREPYLARQIRSISYDAEEYHKVCADGNQQTNFDGPPTSPSVKEIPVGKSQTVPELGNLRAYVGTRNLSGLSFVDHLRRRCPAAHLVLLICFALNLEVLRLQLPGTHDTEQHGKCKLMRIVPYLNTFESISPRPLSKPHNLMLEGYRLNINS